MAPAYLERRLIGEILVERHLVTAAQLKEALSVQKRSSPTEFIGLVLARLGYVSEIDVVTALVLQCNLPFIAVSKHQVDEDVLGMIPPELARKSRLVPLDRIGNILSVVMQNPLDEECRKGLELSTGCHVAVFVSTSHEIEKALNQFYPV